MQGHTPSVVFNTSSSLWRERLHKFTHPAMATIYEIFIIEEDGDYARQAAFAAFAELDRLEQELSRFVANSDVARINNLPAGKPLRLGLDAFACLEHAARIHAETNGAFDITVGGLMDCWLNRDQSLRAPSDEEIAQARRHLGTSLLQLNGEEHTVLLERSPVHVDLGGIGKGYAIGVLAALLREWDVAAALLHGGASSVYALGAPPDTDGWPLTLSHPRDRRATLAKLRCKDQAIGGSGLRKGQHLIDPRIGRPLSGQRAAWVIAPDATSADALSTAFMIMPPDGIADYCAKHAEIRALCFQADEETLAETVSRYGEWQDKFAILNRGD